jgi:uncharacterized protein YjbI with pentapeptide repeats
LICFQFIIQGGGGTTLLADASLRGTRLSSTSLSGILVLADASLHGVSLDGILGLADASLRGASLSDTSLLADAMLSGVSLSGAFLLADTSHVFFSPTHKRTEGRAPLWGSEFTSKDATLLGDPAETAAGLNAKFRTSVRGDWWRATLFFVTAEPDPLF